MRFTGKQSLAEHNERVACIAIVSLLLFDVTIACADPLINEILVNPPDSDDYREYVELWNPAGAAAATGLTLLQIDGNTGTVGVIDEVWSLGGLSFGANGMLVIGDNYNTVPLGGPWSSLVESSTRFGDPSGFSAPDLSNGSFSWFLVSGFYGTRGQDLDTNDDGVLDSTPWSYVADSVGWSDGDTNDVAHSPAQLFQTDGTPDAGTRLPGNTDMQNPASWFNGNVMTTDTDPLGRYYDDSEGSFNMQCGGYLTPGAHNYPQTPLPPFRIVINEVYIDPPITNDDREFIELRSTSGKRENLQGLWLLVIDSAGNTVGDVDEAWNLEGLRTGTNGLLLLGNGYDDVPGGPWFPTISTASASDEPFGTNSTGWGNSDISDNTDLSILLVSNFVAYAGVDLDWNDDLSLEQTPWSAIVDGIGIGNSYAPARPILAFSPDMLARRSDNLAANSPAAWYGGEIDGTGLTVNLTLPGFRLPFLGTMTPGTPNHPILTDSDGDNLPDNWEFYHFASLSTSAESDTDGDGAENWHEYVANTAPANALDTFRISALKPDDITSWILCWTTSVGRTYQLQTASTVTNAWDTHWIVNGDNGRASNSISLDAISSVFRVRALLQESVE